MVKQKRTGTLPTASRMGSFAETRKKPAALEEKFDTQFRFVFDTRREFIAPAPHRRRPIGLSVEERRPIYRKPRRLFIRSAQGEIGG
jgi:hypothetical protein